MPEDDKVVEKVVEKIVEDPKTKQELDVARQRHQEASIRAKAAEDELTKLRDEVKKFEGVDVDAVKKLLSEREEAEKSELERKGEFDRLKQMMAEKHKEEKDELRKKVKEKESTITQFEQRLNDLTVGSQFSSSRFINSDLVLTPDKARAIYGSHFEVEDGEVVAYDKPRGAGSRTKLVDGQGDPVAFEDALRRLVDKDPDKDRLLRSKMRSGADSRTVDKTVEDRKDEKLYGVSRIQAALRDLKTRKNS